jgi:hypothetical protein
MDVGGSFLPFLWTGSSFSSLLAERDLPNSLSPSPLKVLDLLWWALLTLASSNRWRRGGHLLVDRISWMLQIVSVGKPVL